MLKIDTRLKAATAQALSSDTVSVMSLISINLRNYEQIDASFELKTNILTALWNLEQEVRHSLSYPRPTL